MPTYQYKCEECGYEFERFQQITSSPHKLCPSCNKKSLVRLIGSGSGIIFKGVGWPGQDIARKRKLMGENNGNEKN